MRYGSEAFLSLATSSTARLRHTYIYHGIKLACSTGGLAEVVLRRHLPKLMEMTLAASHQVLAEAYAHALSSLCKYEQTLVLLCLHAPQAVEIFRGLCEDDSGSVPSAL